MANSGTEVFALLRDIETRSRQKALGLPQQLEIRHTETGIGFLLQDMALVVATSEISEILPYPPLTRIPGTLNWMRGVANIRGTLVPIIDLLGFAKQETTRLNRKSRILVMHRGDLVSGLLVTEVLGLRHFFEEEKTTDLPPASARLQGLLDGGYQQGDQHWGIFSTRRLADMPEFINVAAEV
ncbi:MAG TPA: chemotaxis protein CheW [Gammaproteobacteria bacterium]|nr:chemotaxis protein CheW [Gammaproteobacteria bacterium]